MPGNMLSKGEVFVIDTDAASREQLSTALQQSAYNVICFADGASLLSEAKARMPACVLLEMPPDRPVSTCSSACARKTAWRRCW